MHVYRDINTGQVIESDTPRDDLLFWAYWVEIEPPARTAEPVPAPELTPESEPVAGPEPVVESTPEPEPAVEPKPAPKPRKSAAKAAPAE